MKPLYFDHNASTPIHPEVLDAMMPYLTDRHGNPGCAHNWGRQARQALEKARSQVAALINSDPAEIIFTSCATASNNIVLFGTFRDSTGALRRGNLVVSSVEHPSVMEPARALERRGIALTTLPVDETGTVSAEEACKSCTPETELVSVMLANNETGVIQPIRKISSCTFNYGCLFHTDASQAVGKIPVDVRAMNVDFMTIAGHKFYAPKGVGALYVRNVRTIFPLLYGGAQERGMKPGTENMPGIVGLGAACELARRTMGEEVARQRELGDLLLDDIRSFGADFVVHGEGAERLPNTLSIGFRNAFSNQIVERLDEAEVAVSSGSVCHKDNPSISPVLQAMGVAEDYALGTIRISWGRGTTRDDVHSLAERLRTAIDMP